MKTTVELTEKERLVLGKLNAQVAIIIGGGAITSDRARAVAIMCCCSNFPTLFENEDMAEIALVCRSLAEKGMVEVLEVDRFPAFIPISDAYIMETKHRKLIQRDINY